MPLRVRLLFLMEVGLRSTVAAIKSVSPTSTVLQNERCSAAELSAVPNAFKLLFLLGVWFFSTCTVLLP